MGATAVAGTVELDPVKMAFRVRSGTLEGPVAIAALDAAGGERVAVGGVEGDGGRIVRRLDVEMPGRAPVAFIMMRDVTRFDVPLIAVVVAVQCIRQPAVVADPTISVVIDSAIVYFGVELNRITVRVAGVAPTQRRSMAIMTDVPVVWA
jgi:hypothetical protein